MFKLPNLPSAQADPHEMADFFELLSYCRGAVSQRQVLAYLSRIDDNADNTGCDDNDDENADFLDEVMSELERRGKACGSGYPFCLELNGSVLKHLESAKEEKSVLYRYLLLGTRLNMKEKRVHAKIDGTLLLEEVADHILKSFLGPRAKSFVFGTANKGGFKTKVKRLCRELGEGCNFRNIDGKNAPVNANDDKIDTVTWIPFSDSLPGQLILFGQCKTGTNWQDMKTQLQPEAFIKKWLAETILVPPVRIFCISEAADRSRWKSTNVESGILFDRCRLVDFCEKLPKKLDVKLRRWTNAAKETLVLG